ncbi:metal-binding protein [Candidatus Bipolaricaulota bacterium]
MPSGKTHLKVELVLLVPWAALAALLVWREWIAISQAILALGSYVFSMFMLSPDLDLTNSAAFDRWGALRWIWLPYAWVFRHRQTSHHPLLGPLTRILYICVLLLAGTLITQVITGNTGPQLRLSVGMVLPICVGLYLPNLEHIVADRMSTSRRRKRRRRRL